MKWTRELPTKPGWYWFRRRANSSVKMRELVYWHGVLMYEEFGGMKRPQNGGYWCGPLEPPKE